MHIEAKFYDTYYLCSIVDGILKNRFENIVALEAFHCDGQWAGWLAPYKKYSVFHQFIEFVVRDVHSEQAEEVELPSCHSMTDLGRKIVMKFGDSYVYKLPIENAFDHHGIDYQSFADHLADLGKSYLDADDDDVYDFMNEIWLSESYEKLMDQTVGEVFHVLFQNRKLLLNFNDYMSSILSGATIEDAEDLDHTLLSPRGTLLRVRPPKWAQRAVFYRDRGRCVLCDSDLSGLANIENVENYDHIVSLAQFGLNDVSNLQLLCVHCNQIEKKDGAAITSGRYQSWYSTD
ncbi:HNH endonuclease [Janthinobacterium sp. 61]|uniref:HNH endonuclease n=1 Tax=Janthinobacterium sp. 61 TaxID=2035209 RepID=UPI000C708047|nr:HNH endonuclease signature motif containing protein [Janthinobacterium sp. 61]PKV44445.1 HNH endonuclease [Janthinobacterium sp. 61]